MPIEFTHIPGPSRTGDATTPFFFDPAEAEQTLAAVENAGFDRVVIDDAGGLLTNMDLAAQATRHSGALDISLTHWAGSIEPVVAARQLAAIDAMGGGRLSIRMVTAAQGAASGEPASHVETLQRTDEYLVLLKRLWSNDKPIDHEGPAYSLRHGFVARKGPRGDGIPLRMNGLSGTAFRVAGRHADVFELPFATPDHIKHIIDRVRQSSLECGRAGRPKFALPLRLSHFARQEGAGGTGEIGSAIRQGSPERIALALLPYVAMGVSEFMVGGLDSREAIRDFGEHVIPMVRNSSARRDGRERAWPQPAETLSEWARSSPDTARH